MSDTPACSATTKAGKPCGKTVGTTPTPDGPRCASHRPQTRDPGARAPIRNPKTADDVRRLVTWAMIRAAEDQLSAPSANAVAGMARVWLRVNEDKTQQVVEAVFTALDAQQEMMRCMTVVEASRTRYGTAKEALQSALDRLHELTPGAKESDEDAVARETRQRDTERGTFGAAMDRIYMTTPSDEDVEDAEDADDAATD